MALTKISTDTIADSAITAVKIADGTVVAAEIADDAIITAKILNSNVTTAKIAADAIDGTKIADDAINSEHYTDGSIDLAHLAADAIDGTKIADDAIDSEHYTDGSVDDAHLATGISASKITGSLPALTLAGTLTGADQTVSAINLKDYGETTNAIGGTGGGTQDIDLTLGNCVSATVDTSTNTFTFSNPTASDELCSFILFLTNGNSKTVVWPGSVDWEGGTAPSLTTSGVDILAFQTINGGTLWHGYVISTDSKSP